MAKNNQNESRYLGVNIDHVATLRNARHGCSHLNLLTMADLVLDAGATRIVIHLREDRRHICDDDVWQLSKKYNSCLNLEIAPVDHMLDLALICRPATVCIVPERRKEEKTEKATDLTDSSVQDTLRAYIPKLKKRHIEVSCFINPDHLSIDLAASLGFDTVELHTGSYASYMEDMKDHTSSDLHTINFLHNLEDNWSILHNAARYAEKHNLLVHAGHGLCTRNLKHLLLIPQITYFHIGYSIVCRALTIGIKAAVQEIMDILAAK